MIIDHSYECINVVSSRSSWLMFVIFDYCDLLFILFDAKIWKILKSKPIYKKVCNYLLMFSKSP